MQHRGEICHQSLAIGDHTGFSLEELSFVERIRAIADADQRSSFSAVRATQSMKALAAVDLVLFNFAQ